MRWIPVTLLLLTCFLSGSQWLLPGSDASFASDLSLFAVGTMLAAIVPVLLEIRSDERTRIFRPGHSKLILSGIGTIGAPTLLLLLGKQQFSSVMAVATQATLPVIVAVVAGAVDPERELQDGLLPALVALAGTLLVLPVALPRSSHGWIGFSLYLAAAALGGLSLVFCHREMIRFPRGVALAVVAGANAVFLGLVAAIWLASTHQWQPLFSQLTAPTLLSVILAAFGVLSLAAMIQLLSPLATASTFVFTPAVATIEAYLFLRPTLSLRTAFGALLMVLGGFACVLAGQRLTASTNRSLH